MKTLLDERYAPITSAMGFIEAPLDRVWRALAGWRRQLRIDTETEELDEPFPQALRRLEPLTTHAHPRELVIETSPSWTLYVSNSLRGTDPAPVAVLAEFLACRSVYVVTTPHTADAPGVREGRFGGLQFRLFGPRPNPILNHVRSIDLIYDGDRWVFDIAGEPQPFEHPDRYKARRLRDRFTSEMLEEYCRALGIEVFDPSFYGSRAVLVRTAVDLPPAALSLSLEEAQAWLEITPGQQAPAVMPA